MQRLPQLLSLLALALIAPFGIASMPGQAQAPTQSQRLEEMHHNLLVAVCLNEWEEAIQLTGPLIASPEISAADRENLMEFRQQLVTFRDNNAVVSGVAGCDQALARYVVTVATPSTPLDWDNALNTTFGAGAVPTRPDQVARQEAAIAEAKINLVDYPPIPALSPATPIDTSSGFGVSAGQVSTGESVFTFYGGLGDRVSLDVDVTEVLAGTLYTDDDSQIFLFDSQGTLLADNDDLSRLQSRITDFVLPQSGLYYAVVTTYNNDPILNSLRQVEGWGGNGGSRIEFTLSVTGLTPPSELVLP